MCGLDQLVNQLTFMREREQTQGEPEQAMPQVGRTLVVDEGGYRQVQREPNAHDFQNRRHGRLTARYLRSSARSHMQKLARYARALHNPICLNHSLELLFPAAHWLINSRN